MFCDLHAHSTASDGTTPPEALPALARAAGLAALALTDHDTTAGIPACAAAAGQLGIAFVPGIEISADRQALPGSAAPATGSTRRRGTLHLLGLFVDPAGAQLQAVAREVLEARDERNPRIIARLRELGVPIELAEVEAVVRQAGGRVVGRPHIARTLVAKGCARSIQEAFDRYLGEGAAAYVAKDHLAPQAAIDAIHAAGGLAILAHPVQLRCADAAELRDAVERLREMGLDGLETRHCDHTPADVAALSRLAGSLGLLESGGSDFHGDRKHAALGSQRVPLAVHEALRAAATARARRAPARGA